MDSNTVIGSGTGQGTGTVTLNTRTALLKIKATSDAVVKLNGFNVAISAADTFYQDFPIDVYPEFTVVSGTINWVAIA